MHVEGLLASDEISLSGLLEYTTTTIGFLNVLTTCMLNHV